MEAHLTNLNNGMTMDAVSKLSAIINDGTTCLFSVKRVVDRQVKKTIKAKDYICSDNQQAVLNVISDALKSLERMQCGICGLKGHSNAYCWLNG